MIWGEENSSEQEWNEDFKSFKFLTYDYIKYSRKIN